MRNFPFAAGCILAIALAFTQVSPLIPQAPPPPGPVVNPAASLSLPSTVTGDPGDFITVGATTNCPTVKWLTLDKGLKQFPSDLLKDTKTGVFLGSVPGSYRIAAYTSNAVGPSDPAICIVTINGAPPAPTPNPTPGPGPAPTPAPTASAVWVMAIYDSATIPSVPGLQGILTDDTLWASIKSKGSDWQKFTTQDARYATYKPILDGSKVSPPAIVLLSKTGTATEKVLQVVPMPADSASVSKLIMAITGK